MNRSLFILMACCLWGQVAVNAQPLLETGPKKSMPDEWIDQDTHHKIVRLSRIDGNSLSFYFHNNPFIGDKMVFYNTGRDGKQLYTVDLRTLKTERITEVHPGPAPDGTKPGGVGPSGEIVGSRSRSVYYQVGDSVFATNIDTRETRLIFVFSPDFRGSVSTLNADETLMAGVQSGEEEKAILRKFPEKHDFFNRIYDAHIPHTLFTIDIKSGELRKIHAENTWIGHVQFSPTNPELLMFCHEGPWHKVDRIWTIDVRTKDVKLMHKRTVDNEIAGHEFFSPDGGSIWFDWQIPKGKTFYLGNVDVRTGVEKKFAMTRDEWSIHFATSSDQRLFAGDGGDSGQVAHARNGRWIYLFRPERDHFVSEKLVNMKDQYYKLEPNVHFSPDGRWIIFRANFEGKEEVYAVEIKKSSVQLQWPAVSSQTKPWTRWWWMGSAVDRPDLTANMEKYRDAGLGGLELTPIYGVRGYESQFIDYLSPQWMNMFSYTLGEARRLGLGLDMSTGTGWPFGGGPLIDSSYACKDFVYKSWSLKGGEQLQEPVIFMQEPLVHTDGGLKPAIDQLVEPVFANKDLQGLALFQLRFSRRLPLQALMAYSAAGNIVDLTGKVDDAGHLHWRAGEAVAISGGGGDWTLYAIFQGWHGKMVERAAPGAEGNVIDHFSSVALKKYLSRFDKAFAGHRLEGLRAFFNDSYEVDDARGQSNWTPGFFELFRHYQGYDLRKHLPALLGKDSTGNNERVLCDYRETISDLLLDQFTRPWRAWAKSKGAIVRNQAHGSPANILDLYAASDIPETEGADVYRYKFATSVAHVTGKQLVSSESVTWLGEHFLASLSDVKKALDNYLLGGVNHIFYHGTAYSPKSDPWPGWLFYASVHFTPNDPSWQNFSTLNNYVARCQSFLQQGRPDNDILLYYPIYDSWSEPGHDLLKHFDRMEPEFNGTGFEECAEVMQRDGYAYDYISDRQLRETDVVMGARIRTSGGGLYQTVLVPDCRHMPEETLQQLIRLAEKGATILVYKGLPADVPGWENWQVRKEKRTQWMERLHFLRVGGDLKRAMIGKGAFMMGGNLVELLAASMIRREKMVADSLECVRRSYAQGNYYFIVNKGSRKWAGYVPLAANFGGAAIFNPMDGSYGLATLRVADGKEVYLQLLPGETVVVQTSRSPPQAAPYPYYGPAGEPSPITGKWKIKFMEGGPVLPPAVTVDRLGSWTALGGDAVKSFSGTASYSLSFRAPWPAGPLPAGKGRAWMLDLGKVDGTAQVFLNGKKLATLIGPFYQVVIPASAICGENMLEVRVSNGMANRIADMDRRGVVWKKFYNYNFPAHDKENRNAKGLFDASAWKPLNSGLSGPVSLIPLELTVAQDDPAWTKQVGARAFPSSERTVRVNDYGAAKNGAVPATRAIQSAIDACAAKGGGVVVFEPGVYLSGALFLKDGVELRIGKEVELRGSQHFEDYPLIDTRIAGIGMKWPAALLNIIGVKNAAVTGEGTVNAQGKFCWDKYWSMRKDYDARGLRWIVDYDAQRIRTLLIQDGSDITIRGVRFVDAGFWTVQVLYSKYVTVDGIIVRNNEGGHGPSTDGVDIDSSSWVLVENCDIDCNDDDFCLKAGRDWDGLRVNRPTEYVVIRNCIARKGGGLLTIGSETSGGIRHVLATDLKAKGTGNGFHIKSAITRGGTVEDIHVRNITMDSVGNAILFTMNWNPAYSYSTLPAGYNPDSIPEHWKTLLHKVDPPEKGIPHFKDIYISGVQVAHAKKAISATGLETSLITNVHIKNCDIYAGTAGETNYVKDWEFRDVTIHTDDATQLTLKNTVR